MRHDTIAAVIFDMDGVLVDSEPLHIEAARRVLGRHGVPPDEAENEEFIGHTDVEIFGILRARHGLAPDEHELTRQFCDEVVRMLAPGAQPLAGVPAVLEQLRDAGYRLALASSSTREVIGATLAALGLGGMFEVIVSSAEVGRGKPAPDVFLETARRLGVAPAACLVVEDSRNGMLAARAAGMRCVAIPCGPTLRQNFAEATWVVASLPEICALLPSPVAATNGRP